MKQVNLRIYRAILPLLLGLFLSLGAYAQQVSVRGHVKDTFGDPVIGANVVVKDNSTIGTITDLDGNFTLSVPANSVLQVSFIGYRTAEVAAATNLVITLEDDAIMLQEAVVIGYGTVKKNDLTGSVTAIKPDAMNKGLVTNAQDMLSGKIAGVSVISDGGTPGGGAQIRIRGGSSLSASNDPLIVIDGLAMDNEGVQGLANPLSMVNPNDIESFTVLKDASATAIYGSRASNGVIIITTKKGTLGGKPKVSYDGNVSVSTNRKTVNVLNGDEYRALIGELYNNDPDVMAAVGTANTDWQKEIYRVGINTDHNVSVSGGVANMPYRVSLGYTNQNGVLKTSNFERYTASLNLSPTFFDDHLKINMNGKFMYARNRYADTGAIGSALAMNPAQPVYGDGEIYQKYFGGFYQWDQSAESIGDPDWERTANALSVKNPVSLLELKDDRAKSHSFIGSVDLDYKFHFLPDMRWHMTLGGDWSGGSQTTKISPYSGTNNYYGHYGYIEKDKYNLSLSTYLMYGKDFGNQYFDIIGGYEWQHFYNDGNEIRYGNYRSTHPTEAGKKTSEYENAWKTENFLVSFFARANYNLLERYLLTATVRYDGTSRFSKDHRWGFFPSVALGWKINEEAFMEDVDIFSDLKLRLGYGVTGQQNINQGDYPYLPVYSMNIAGAYYQLGDEWYTLYRPDAYNKDLKWEETTTWNVGIDYGFLNGRITGSADYYLRKTKDLLNVVSVPAGTNFKNQVISNIGSLKNEGFEFAINTKPVLTRDFSWDLGFNLTYNKNKITKLTTGTGEGYYVAVGGISSGTGSNIQAHVVGHPANSFYVYQQVYDENGHPIENLFVDRNGDGIINEADKYLYKKPAGDVLMGLNSKFIYKNWDLSFTLRASLNNYVYNDVLADRSNISADALYNSNGFSNRPKEALKLGYQGIGSYYYSDYFVQNASFLRCDNISLGYSFSNLFNSKINGRVYANFQNVFVITKYDGLDPELTNGIDNNIYPRPFVALLGVSLNF
ncbi:MAG: TonB-dependent receptor [Bacteroides sp.]|nr:TonB-dependent receptor [Bacteroides sp.]